MECCPCPKENRTQCGLARLEVRLVRLGRLAYRPHQPRLHIHNLVCAHHCIRHLVCNHNRSLLVQQSVKNLGQNLERFGRMPELTLRLDCTMHTEPELGFGKQTGSQQQQINKLVIEVALKILFHSRKNIRRKSVLRRSPPPQNIILSLLAVIPAVGSC